MSQNNLLIVIAIFSALLCSPVLAEDSSDDNTGRDDTQVYSLYDGVDLVSTLKIEYDKPRIVMKCVYPQLEMASDPEASIAFNQMVKDLLKQEMTEFKNRVTQAAEVQSRLVKKDINNNLYIDYDTSALKSGKNHLLSIRFSIQGRISGLKHPYHYHRVLNINLDDNQPLALSDLFIPGSSYLSVLSHYSQDALKRRLTNGRMIQEGTLPKEENYKVWNMKANGILITFDEYQVAPYFNGPQMILVPYSILKKMISSDSLIASCITHNTKCAQNNALTGGFIDQAVNARHRFFNPLLGKL